MLKDAALLQLELLETSMKNGWTIKDATPYNIQWRGANPIFIDIPSFVPMKKAGTVAGLSAILYVIFISANAQSTFGY